MDKNCGSCGKCRNTHDGPYCYKGRTPRPVSPLRVMDCWVDPDEVEKEPQATKVCSHCGRELPVANFGRHSRTKDGYQPCCKECQSEMNKGHRKRQPYEHNEAPEKTPDLTAEQMGIGKGRRSTHPSYVDKDTGTTMKYCNSCHRYLPIDEFHHNKANKDGYEFDCKECRAARRRSKNGGEPKTRGRKHSHPDTEVDGVRMHWCGKCKQYKPEEEFSRDKSNKSGLATQCKACRVVLEHERRVRNRTENEKKASEDIEVPPTPGGLLMQEADAAEAHEHTDQDDLRDSAENCENTAGPGIRKVGVQREVVVKITDISDISDERLVEELQNRGYQGYLVRKTSFLL